jgi:DNA-directed RNA polymerase subunit RPC12/RpoP
VTARTGGAAGTGAAETGSGRLRVRAECDGCGEPLAAAAHAGELSCAACGRSYDLSGAAEFEQCPICDCRRFFRQKAFPRVLGIGLVVVGAALVPFTYGVSLMVLALVDLLIYRGVPMMAVCYLCRAEFRGVPVPDRILPFRHHMAEGYEKRRERRDRQRPQREGQP